jgi:hypothetical protein
MFRSPLQLLVLAFAHGSRLMLTGTDSDVLFGNSASLTATCAADRTLGVRRFRPAIVDYVSGAASPVRATLLGVPPACSGLPVEQPCGSPGPDAPPLFYCNWTIADASIVLGPLSANHTEVYSNSGRQLLGIEVHCDCPPPSNEELITKLSWKMGAKLKLSVLHFAPRSSSSKAEADATQLPFSGLHGGDELGVNWLSPPPPPPSPPPPDLADCHAIKKANPSAQSGEYSIDGGGAFSPPLRVHCDMETDSGYGYTVILRLATAGCSSSTCTSSALYSYWTSAAIGTSATDGVIDNSVGEM